MKTKFNGILMLLLAVVVQFSFAQEKTVSGTVSDDSGPLPGVSIIIKGTTKGTDTDFDGKYSISVNTGDVLVFSYLGYKTVERTVGTSTSINVTLEADANVLEEVVVTGVAQGTSTKKLGFKVEKVSVEGVATVPTPDAASALIGKVAGAQIVRGSGNPLRTSAIVLRGASSIEGSSSPLIIIDGIITTGNLNDLNMEDVESMEVIKGAAASSLYGSLAGNGVIQIITKKGKSEKPTITLKTEYGFSSIANKYPSAILHDRLLDSNGNFDTSSGAIVADPNGIHDNPWPNAIVDNIGEFINSQGYSQLSASIAQRVNKINYFFSAQRAEVQGVIDGLAPYIRQSARLNVSSQLSDNLNVTVNANVVTTKGNEAQQAGQGDNLFFNFLTADPTVSMDQRDADGNFVPFFSGNGYINEYQNPLYVARNQSQNRENRRFIGGATLNYSINDDLTLIGSASIDRTYFRYRQLFPRGYVSGSQPNATVDNGFIFIRNFFNTRVNSSIQLNFNKSWDDFNFRSSARYLHEDVKTNYEDGQGSNFLTQGVETLQQATQNIQVFSSNTRNRTQNFFLTADLDWKDKVIIGGLIRSDRSSLFGEDNRDQIFFRGSFAYRAGEDIDVDWIDELKFRASYGTAGLRPAFGDIFETFTVTQASVSPNQVGNPDLQSPTIKELEVGVDFDFLGKYQLGLTYAQSNTEDALITVPLSGAVPGTTQVRNVGETEYTSYELSFSGTPVSDNNGFSWNFGITASSTENEYVDLGEVAPFNRIFIATLFDSAPAINVFRVEAGQPYGAMFGNALVRSLDELTVVNGVVVNEGLNLPLSAFSVNEFGHVIVTANDGASGLVNAGGEQAIRKWDPNTGQLAVERIGDTNPDFIMGVSNTFTYKNFTLYTLIDAQFGGDIYNYTKQLLYFNDRHGDLDTFGLAGQPSSYANASSTIYNLGAPMGYFVEDATFVKIREISLSYLLAGKDISEKLQIDDIKLTLSGRNLVTFTDYSGWDPEVSVNSSAIFKLDEFAYPNFRTFAFSVQVRF